MLQLGVKKVCIAVLLVFYSFTSFAEEAFFEVDENSYLFGDYTLRLNLSKYKFSDKLLHYSEHYTKKPLAPSLSLNWYFWKKYVAVGVGVNVAYFSNTGHALDGDGKIDEQGLTNLSLLPVEISFSARVTPFPSKWVVLTAWIGREYLSWSETRLKEESNDSEDQIYVNKDNVKSLSYGVSLDFILNWLDESNVASMTSVLGLKNIYLSPYIRVVSNDSTVLAFARSEVGLSFNFESL